MSIQNKFIDFKKAFDSLYRDTLWKTRSVPQKMETLIGLFYRHFECCVIFDGKPYEWFPVESGVRQVCILSPILFLVAID